MTHPTGAAWGVDGCKAGWFYFCLPPPPGEPPYGVVERLERIVQMAGNEDSVLVDIPIGLPNQIDSDGRDRETAFRKCDEEARDKLGNRRASVFPVPVRPVVEILRDGMGLRVPPKDDAEKKLRRWRRVRYLLDKEQLTVEKGEGRITAQSFAILPKIVEADDLLRGSAKARKIVRETHPEVCFSVLVGDDRKERLETFSKKHGLGFLNRVAILEACHPDARRAIFNACEDWPKIASDDIVDAMACAVTAWLILHDKDSARVLPRGELHRKEVADRPDPPEIVYAVPSKNLHGEKGS